jgi:predicted P-loop ATPase
MPNISLFKNAFANTPETSIVFEQYLENVKNGTWQDYVIEVRRIKQKGDKEAYNNAKAKVPSVTASGTFTYRNGNGLDVHSGIIAIDFDTQDNPDGIFADQLAADAYTYAIHKSIGGDGFVVYVKIEADKHLDAFLGLEVYYLNNYKMQLDKSCKNVDRLRFVSWDIDLTINPKAKIFKAYIPKKKQMPPNRVYTQGTNDVEHIINQVVSKGIDLTDNYANWIGIGFGFAKEYGEGGRSYFHSISSVNSKYDYDKCNAKFNNLLSRAGKADKSIGIGTFIFLASLQGVDIKTARTAHIEAIAKLRRSSVGTSGGCKTVEQAKANTLQYLADIDGIEGADVEQVVDKVMAMEAEQLKSSLTGDLLQDAINYVKMLDLRFNEITRGVELYNVPITDNDMNGLFLTACRVLKDSQKGKTLGYDTFERIVNSPEIEKYNPFMEFFQRNAAMKPTGLLDAFLECFIFEDSYKKEDKETLKFLAGKWLLSIVASMHGTYSIICLVLCGAMRKGKTNFFRYLLPPDLTRYYGESKLDREKDDEILMTQKLILLDDEFSGKSKKDSEKLKDLLSKQWFNVRPAYARRSEDLRRIAVLCGSSNNDDVLNDLTGNRRIIPLNIKNIDWVKYKQVDKTMLFMELYNLYIENPEVFMLDESDIASLNRITAINEETCTELEAINMYFGLPSDYPSQHPSFYTPTALKVEIENISKTLRVSPKKLGAAVKKLGVEKSPKKVNGSTIYGYYLVKLQS